MMKPPLGDPQRETAFKTVRELAAALHVELEIIDLGELWFLNSIKRRKGAKRGTGAVVLLALHALADQECKRVSLRAGDWTKRRHVKLVRYYENLGYVVVSGNQMIRSPRSAWPRSA